MKHLPRFWASGFACLLLSLPTVVLSEEAADTPTAPTTDSADSVAVQRITVQNYRVVDATIEAVHQATVSAQTQGRIISIPVDVDDYVSKGTIIVQLRDKDQRAALNAATANFEEANAEYKRVAEVYERKLVAKSELDKARARLKAAQARLDQAGEALEHTRIRAPYSGIVVKRHVEVGETARPGQKLMTGLSLEKLRASVNLPQSLIHKVRQYKKTWVWVGDNLDQKIEASSLTISAYADPQSHTFLVRVNLPEGDHHVYPGMYTKVAFLTGQRQSLVIPDRAIARRSEVTGVYVRDASQRIEFRYIRSGNLLEGDQREILAGLNEGETVLLDPIAAVASLKTSAQTE